MNDAELFTRLYYYGTVHLRMESEQFWLTPMGLFLDLWTCHRQYLGLEKTPQTVDDIIPFDC